MKKISFTGSTAIAKIIAGYASSTLKKSAPEIREIMGLTNL